MNAINMAKKSATVPEISNFFWGIIFFGVPVYLVQNVSDARIIDIQLHYGKQTSVC